jgi:hypothetical protein
MVVARLLDPPTLELGRERDEAAQPLEPGAFCGLGDAPTNCRVRRQPLGRG